MYRNWIGPKPFSNLFHNPKKVCASPIHLIDEHHARNFITVGLPPYGFRLRFDPGSTTKNNDRAVENPEATLYLNSKINVAGRIDNVYSMFFILLVHSTPETSGGRRRNGDTALLFLFHPVHHGCPVMDLANLMREPGIEKHTFSCRSLARIDVSDNTDISITSYRRTARHNLLRSTVLLRAFDSKSIVGKSFVCVRHTVSIFPLSY